MPQQRPAIDTVPTPEDDTLASAIARQLPDDITEETVQSVLTAMATVREGDPVGTIRRDPDSGALAHRVDNNGVPVWRISGVDGTQWSDMRPTLDWPTIGGE